MPLKPNLFYYANARLGGKTSLLAGPFMDPNKAQDMLAPAAAMFAKMNPQEAEQASYGIMSCSKFAGYGHFNLALVEAGATDVPLPDQAGIENFYSPLQGNA